MRVQRVQQSDASYAGVYKWEFYYKTVILLVSLTLDKSGKIVAFDAVDDY